MKASGNGHTEEVKLLLRAKAQTDIRNQMGFTALRMAIADNHDETAGVLIKDGLAQVLVPDRLSRARSDPPPDLTPRAPLACTTRLQI